MKNLTLTALALTLLPFGVFANEAPTVVDPVTGVETTVDQLDFQAMTPSQISDVRTQVQANAPDHARNMRTQMDSQKDMQEADAGTGERSGMSGMSAGKGNGMDSTSGEAAGADGHGEGTGGDGASGNGGGMGGNGGSNGGSGNGGGGNGGGMGGNGSGMGG